MRRVALEARAVLEEHGLQGFPKTSGSRGMHVNVPIEPRWDFTEVRRAALALAREVERRMPEVATSAWWKEERGERVFIDYNQNARDRTVASAYSVRANPEGRVSCPLDWDEVPDAEPSDLTLATVPARFAERGDPGAGIDDRRFDLGPLLELAARDEAGGLGDAPWPPHFAKQKGEPRRVAPGRARDRPGTPEPTIRRRTRPRRRWGPQASEAATCSSRSIDSFMPPSMPELMCMSHRVGCWTRMVRVVRPSVSTKVLVDSASMSGRSNTSVAPRGPWSMSRYSPWKAIDRRGPSSRSATGRDAQIDFDQGDLARPPHQRVMSSAWSTPCRPGAGGPNSR